MFKISRALAALGLVCAVGGAQAALVNFSGDLFPFSVYEGSTNKNYSYQGGSISGALNISDTAISVYTNQATGETVSRFSISGSIHSNYGSSILDPDSFLALFRYSDQNQADSLGIFFKFSRFNISSDLDLVALNIEIPTPEKITTNSELPNINFLTVDGQGPLPIYTNTAPISINSFTFSGYGHNLSLQQVATPNPVPIPAAAWLMLFGLGALGAAARRRNTSAVQP